MTRTITLSAVVALLLSSVAFGQIGNIGPQTQAWNMGLGGTVELYSGQGTASNSQSLLMVDAQYANTSEGTTAFQGFGGLMKQSATVSNVGAPIGVAQTAGINGDQVAIGGAVLALGQMQSFSAYGGPAAQYQGVEVGASQILQKDANGAGKAEAENKTGMGMLQAGGTDFTTMGQGSLIAGTQKSSLEGETAASASLVTTSVNAIVVQQQAANCAISPCPPVQP